MSARNQIIATARKTREKMLRHVDKFTSRLAMVAQARAKLEQHIAEPDCSDWDRRDLCTALAELEQIAAGIEEGLRRASLMLEDVREELAYFGAED